LKRIDLADGSYLTGSSMSSMTLFPEERVVSVSIVDGVATLTTSGTEPEVVATVAVATVAVANKGGGNAPTFTKPAAPAGEPGSKEASRWETLNGFVDVVLQTLHPTEVVVWLLLYRRANASGSVSASNRGIVAQTGLGLRSVARAMKRLRELGLIADKRLSCHKGDGASLYQMTARPATCRTRPKTTRRAPKSTKTTGATVAPGRP
jgi:hypothetical protein